MLSLLDFLKTSPEFSGFLEIQATSYILLFLAIGFLVLLVEIRLPLKYYWDLPLWALRRYLEFFRLGSKTPVWGYCLDGATNRIIPLAAVELLEAETKKAIVTTYSNRLGQYGFRVYPGSYVLRAVKNHYKMPSVLDPENIELVKVEESYAIPLGISVNAPYPKIDIRLVPIESLKEIGLVGSMRHYLRTFLFTMSNLVIGFSTLGALMLWVYLRRPQDGLLIAVGITLLFIKIYILETVARAAADNA